MADNPDWVQLVQILAGVVQATIDTSGGPVMTTINTAGGPVQMTVTNNSLTVQTAPGQSLTVAGTVNSTITGSNVTIDTNTMNAYVADNPLVLLMDWTQAQIPASAVAGASIGLANSAVQEGLYDGFRVIIDDPSNQAQYLGNLSYFDFFQGSPHGYVGSYLGSYTSSFYPGTNCAVFDILLPKPVMGSNINVSLITTHSTTAAPITFRVYGIQATVDVNNASTAPVHTQPINGSPTAVGMQTLTGAATTPMIASGGVIKRLLVTLYVGNAALPNPTSLHVINGSANVASYNIPNLAAGANETWEIDFADGVANNGISVYLGSPSSLAGFSNQATAYAVMQ